MTIDALLLGGGVGRRFLESSSNESALPKQFKLLQGTPVFVHAVRALVSLGCIRQVVFVVPKSYLSFAQDHVDRYFGPQPEVPIRLIAGGDRRQDSSRLALESLEATDPQPTRVLIHDACRPYLSPALLERVHKALYDRSYGAWIPTVPVVETVKKVESNQVQETVPREQIQLVQTPQVFEYSVVRSLMERTKSLEGTHFTDDAALCEYYGIPVGVFEGDVRNLKLTYDFEIATLASLLGSQAKEASCEPESASTSIA